MAAPAIIGFSNPRAANGIAAVLYPKAQNRFCLMTRSVLQRNWYAVTIRVHVGLESG